jgi:hypothetical protein
MKLRIVPTNLKTANEFVRKLHRHSRPGRPATSSFASERWHSWDWFGWMMVYKRSIK